jgi:hypothetical protein
MTNVSRRAPAELEFDYTPSSRVGEVAAPSRRTRAVSSSTHADPFFYFLLYVYCI